MAKTISVFVVSIIFFTSINSCRDHKTFEIEERNIATKDTFKQIDVKDSLRSITVSEKEILRKNTDAWLTEMVDSTLDITSQKTFDSLVLFYHKLDIEDNEDILFDLTTKWILKSSSEISAKGCNDPIEGKKSYARVKEHKYVMTGHDIYDIFNLKKDEKPLNHIPYVVGRIDKCNAILLDSNTFIIQYIHSYPDGGRTCFYDEKRYRFVRYNE